MGGGVIFRAALVRKTPYRPRSWANFSLLSLYSRWNAWANLHLLGQPKTFLTDAALLDCTRGEGGAHEWGTMFACIVC
jgi:hypothetical protein